MAIVRLTSNIELQAGDRLRLVGRFAGDWPSAL